MSYLSTKHEAQTSDTSVLAMLSYARPEGSKAQEAFITRFLEPLGIGRDKAGNCIKRIGTAPVLWSSHTDTVHRKAGKQKLFVTGDRGKVGLDKGSKFDCLGADDTAGVWLMAEMIRAEKPGLYIFHTGEEVGGIGSSFIADKTPALLNGIKYAIALDRKGYDSVISHQWSRCCSDDFAWELSRQLGGEYKPDDTGTFTDTANYTDFIGECTNLSVGYHEAHSNKEWLDLHFLEELRHKLINEVNIDSLPTTRLAGEIDRDLEKQYQFYVPKKKLYVPGGAAAALERAADLDGRFDFLLTDDKDDDRYELYNRTDKLVRLIGLYPDIVADFLEHLGVEGEEVAKAVVAAGYSVDDGKAN